MKISKEKQNAIKKTLVRAAVEIFTEKGFPGATMREISLRAGLSAGTIYNYFPNKEKIFYAYFELKQDELKETLSEISDFGEFTFKEKLQTLLESLLDSYTVDRKFVTTTFKILLDSPMKSFTELGPTREKYAGTVRTFFAESVKANEIPSQPFLNFLVNLFWDYTNLIILYWLRDDSEGCVNTSRLIDLSLDLYVDVIASRLITKAVDVLLFFIKGHIYGNFDKLYEFFSSVVKARIPQDRYLVEGPGERDE